jgi:hypothetical protein
MLSRYNSEIRKTNFFQLELETTKKTIIQWTILYLALREGGG